MVFQFSKVTRTVLLVIIIRSLKLCCFTLIGISDVVAVNSMGILLRGVEYIETPSISMMIRLTGEYTVNTQKKR